MQADMATEDFADLDELQFQRPYLLALATVRWPINGLGLKLSIWSSLGGRIATNPLFTEAKTAIALVDVG